MSEVKGLRALSVGLLILTLVFVGGLASIVFLIRDPLPVVRLGSATSFSSAADPERVVAQLSVDANAEFVLVFEDDTIGEMALPPRIALNMPSNEQWVVEPTIQNVGHQRYQANGRLGLPGRWQIQIEYGPTSHVFDFILAAF
ncbi:MAG: hypothetical protein AB7G07_16285 [Bauldia sp.]